MAKVVKFIKDWMLPLAIIIGIFSYLILFFVNPLARNFEPGFSKFAKDIQPILVATMLFLQFNTISPHDLKFRKWHLIALAFQIVMFIALTGLATMLPSGGDLRILVECAMLCFICPTAAAAGVITGKLGGSLSDTVSYVVLINIAAAVILPLVIPFVNPNAGTSFLDGFIAICMRVFPLLVLPLLLAWAIRYTLKRLQRWLMRYTLGVLFLGNVAGVLDLSCYQSLDEQRNICLDGNSDRNPVPCLHDNPVRSRKGGRKNVKRQQGPPYHTAGRNHRRPGARPEELRLPDLAGIFLYDASDLRRRRPVQHLAEHHQFP